MGRSAPRSAPARQEQWTSRSSFLLSAIGFAVGLGNIWRFPYLAGENGGGAFILIYLAVVISIGIPMVAAELLIGRRAGLSPVGSMRANASEAGASPAWAGVGTLALIATFLILTFYAMIAGWAASYLWHAATTGFAGLDAAASQSLFDRLLASPVRLSFWSGVMLALAVFVVRRGVNAGIETASFVLMPMLFAALVFLAGYGTTLPGFGEAALFLFDPDFGEVTGRTFLVAIGQAFFSVGIAMGGMMTYGAYMPRTIKVPGSAVIIVAADGVVAMVAGLAIFPIVFSNGMGPAEGTGLVFQSLPIVFGSMAYGGLAGILFFLLLVAAALTSMIANLEPLVAWATERSGQSRSLVAPAMGIVIFGLGMGSILSFNILADVHPFGMLPPFADMTIYETTDFVASNILLPVGALLTAIFAGWIRSRRATADELELPDGALFGIWLFLVRFVAPCAIAALMLFGLFV